MAICSCLLLTATFALAAGHDAANPVYHALREPGLAVSPTVRVALPAPSMADGLDAKAQQAVLKALAGEEYAVDELVRKSVVAPHVLRIRHLTPSDPQAPARGVDVWFVAYGDLKTVANKDFLDRLLNSHPKEGKGQELSSADLTKRGIRVDPARAKYEGYGHVVFTFLDRVEISATGHSFWNQTDDSVLVAAQLDPRFRQDADFANRWRSLTRDDEGNIRRGPPQPYEGAGYYVKVTRLVEPRGALLVEAHVVFTEPLKWFDGANLLRSKLPPVVQTQVRSIRRELLKASP
jgi:hypothetical protein